MLSKDVLSVLRDNMSIDIEHLFSKISSASMSPYASACFSSLTRFSSSLNNRKSTEKINSIASEMSKSISSPEFEEFIDSMRHAFISFSSGGIHDLFLYQENQAWYPKIRLNKPIFPNDINALSSVVLLYRGCNRSEYSSRTYGQSWSTSEGVAYDFAFIHYSSQAGFNRASRCILMAKVYRDYVYYSDQRKHEREVAVDTEKLRDVEVHA